MVIAVGSAFWCAKQFVANREVFAMNTKRQNRHHKNMNQKSWAFSLSSERLFILGATATRSYAALQMADGHLRLLTNPT